jgi:pimeloyl-ACP methyl ester carboxylesterase
MMRRIIAGVLDVAYVESGEADGWPVVLLHGFPYDVRSYAEVGPALAQQGAFVVVPHLRGYGPTRFRSTATMRSGQQAAMGADLIALLDAFGLDRVVLGGYDWGGRAACIAAALQPERVRGLVTCNGYLIQDIAGSVRPSAPEAEYLHWYQYYFHSERGRAGLAANRVELARLLWCLWSPTWSFSTEEFDHAAASFENPDFVDVVVHSYRHRFGLVDGDPAYEDLERRLAEQPPIRVPTINLDGAVDGVLPARTEQDGGHFPNGYSYRLLPDVGHNPPQEAPVAFTEAVLAVSG